MGGGGVGVSEGELGWRNRYREEEVHEQLVKYGKCKKSFSDIRVRRTYCGAWVAFGRKE